MTSGRSVRLFLVEGTSTGLITAEIVNWTGHLLAGPRTRLDAAIRREELSRTGIYLIYGSDAGNGLAQVYVGEGDNIAKRLTAHARDDQKDFWERFIAVTSKDMNLTKAHVKYLEGRVVTLLTDAKKSKLANKSEPKFDRLPEADISDMESFIEELQLVLPVVGFDYLRKPLSGKTLNSQDQFATEAVFELSNTRKGIEARALENEGEFIILTGSAGSLHETVSFPESQKRFREQVLESGRAEPRPDGSFVLKENIAFTSPSAASVFLHGTSRNGRTDWLLKDTGQTYAEWKSALLDGDTS